MNICNKSTNGKRESIVEFLLEFYDSKDVIEDALSVKIYELELKGESYFMVASDVFRDLEYFLCSSIEEATELAMHEVIEFTSIYERGWKTRISVDNKDFIAELTELEDLIQDMMSCVNSEY